MKKNVRDKLIALGPEELADTLLEMAANYDEVDNLVERLVATPTEKVKRFKAKLSGLKRSRRFIDWREAGSFAKELAGLLADLEESVEDGKTGVDLMARFFECDQAVFDRCDDSSGMVGDVFRYDANTLFTRFAEKCPNKKWLTKCIVKLFGGNDYGARDNLLESAADFLPKENLRTLADQFWQLAEVEKETYRQRGWYRGVEELAAQLGDAPLFEKARLAAWGEPGTAACLDIAEIYLKTGEPQTALAWIERDKDPGSFEENKRNQLLQTIYTKLGEPDKVTEIAWKRFRSYRSLPDLEELLTVIGAEKKEAVIAEQAQEILADKRFNVSDANFLLETGCLDQAEEYLLKSVEQIDGDFYGFILPLAKAMENAERHLAASMLYRALLDSILKRGQTKTYPHGVRYLKKLDKLASAVSNWKQFSSHEMYKEAIRLAHGRKYSFWGKYEK